MLKDDGSFEIKLKRPVKHGDDDVSVLVVREPVAKDLRSLPESPNTGHILDLAAKLCNVPPMVIDQLKMQDTKILLEVVGNFIEGGLATGGGGSEP